MKVIFVGSVCSKEKYRLIFENRETKFIDPAQKFLEQLIRGTSEASDSEIIVVSALPVSSSSYKKYLFRHEEEVSGKVKYIYPGFLNGKILRYFSGFLSTFTVLHKILRKTGSIDTVIITDPLTVQVSMAARLIGRIHCVKSIAIVTDVPIYATEMKNHNYSRVRHLFQQLYERMTMSEIHRYDGYINLTKDMNQIVNNGNKPSIVIEGSVDQQIIQNRQLEIEKDKIIYMYAGGLYEKYGVDNLVQAFIQANIPGAELHLYGSGEYETRLKEICQTHKNIVYKGCVLNSELFEIESKASLLINPRFSGEEYTKYSFPSKTLEYMSTGTPVLSTKLPGIPEDYDKYIYWFDGESIEQMKSSLIKISKKDSTELKRHGENAFMFVATKKNNIIQGKNIIAFSESIIRSTGEYAR